MNNPYHPPSSSLDVPPAAPIQTPAVVLTAFWLLVADWVGGLISLLPAISPSYWVVKDDAELYAALGFTALFMALSAWLTLKILHGHNWARWVLFSLMGIGWFAVAVNPDLFFRDGAVATILNVASLLLEAGAFYLLFLGDARSWFSKSSQSQS